MGVSVLEFAPVVKWKYLLCPPSPLLLLYSHYTGALPCYSGVQTLSQLQHVLNSQLNISHNAPQLVCTSDAHKPNNTCIELTLTYK